MDNRDYLLPGIIAILLAATFPAYMIGEMMAGGSDMAESMYQNLLGFGFLDVVFLLLGFMSIYVYLSLIRILNDQLNFKSLDIILLIMVVACAIFFIGSFSLDVGISLFKDHLSADSRDLILGATLVFTVGLMIVFGLLDLVIGVILLKNWHEIPTLLRAFAIITVVQGWFELTVIFSFAVIFIYPVALIILAMHFLRRPEEVEVV